MEKTFFFLIDFEQQKPILCPLNETAARDIYVQFPAYRNLDWRERLPTEAFYLRKHPMDFTAYQQGFELVQRELRFGNSYLLNLTYPTPIETNYSLRKMVAGYFEEYQNALIDCDQKKEI